MLKFLIKSFKWTAIRLFFLAAMLALLIWSITFHPPALQAEVVVNQAAVATLKSGQQVKILSWNVQYMSGKNYEFWYDSINGDGPDIRAKRTDIEQTFKQVAQLIIEQIQTLFYFKNCMTMLSAQIMKTNYSAYSPCYLLSITTIVRLFTGRQAMYRYHKLWVQWA